MNDVHNDDVNWRWYGMVGYLVFSFTNGVQYKYRYHKQVYNFPKRHIFCDISISIEGI